MRYDCEPATRKIDFTFSISAYPKWFRRFFVWTFPVTGTIWVAAYLLTAIVAGLILGCIKMYEILQDIWYGDKHMFP